MSRPGPGGNIVLVGFMGSGKTEVGRRLAGLTGRQFVDTDALVEGAGLSIPDIFASEGEPGFRRREREAVRKAAKAKDAVIATGGGAVLDESNVKALKKSGVVVYLQASAEEVARRLRDRRDRPLLEGAEGRRTATDRTRSKRVRDLLATRLPTYETVADLVVSVDGRSVEDVAGEVLGRLASHEGASFSSIPVPVDPPYQVYVGRGLLTRAAGLLPVPPGAEKICVVSHPRIARLWGDALAKGLRGTGLAVTRVAFPEGEERKTFETAARLYRKLAAAQFHRGDVLVALGGGVVGDLTGFVASTYGRGIAYVQVPTTLLGMVDSAIGGKTGFNLPEGKNMVGTFHHPLAVLADLDTLRTLADREFRGGLAEVVKYAFIADPSLGDLLTGSRDAILARGDALEAVVARSAAIKAGVVAGDERERGRRAILNYGHTLGHALEAMGWAGRGPSVRGLSLYHGEAISVGMVFAAWVSVLIGLAHKDLVDEHLRLLGVFGLPTGIGRVSWDDVRRYMTLDKKYAKGLRLVLLKDAGDPVVQGDLPADVLQEALRRVTEG